MDNETNQYKKKLPEESVKVIEKIEKLKSPDKKLNNEIIFTEITDKLDKTKKTKLGLLRAFYKSFLESIPLIIGVIVIGFAINYNSADIFTFSNPLVWIFGIILSIGIFASLSILFASSRSLFLKLVIIAILIISIISVLKWIIDVYLSKKEILKQEKQLINSREKWVKDSTEYFNKRVDSIYRSEIFIPNLKSMTQIEPLLGKGMNEVKQILFQKGYMVLRAAEHLYEVKRRGNILEYHFSLYNGLCNNIIIKECYTSSLFEVDSYFLKHGYKRAFSLGMEDPEVYSPKPYYIYINNIDTLKAKVFPFEVRRNDSIYKIRIEIEEGHYSLTY